MCVKEKETSQMKISHMNVTYIDADSKAFHIEPIAIFLVSPSRDL